MEKVLHDKFTIKRLKDNFYLIYQGYDKLIGDNEYVVAVYANPFSSISGKAQKIAAKQYASEKRKKVAIISDNVAHVLIVRFFIAWNKPKTPIKIFKSEEKAFKWLASD